MKPKETAKNVYLFFHRSLHMEMSIFSSGEAFFEGIAVALAEKSNEVW